MREGDEMRDGRRERRKEGGGGEEARVLVQEVPMDAGAYHA